MGICNQIHDNVPTIYFLVDLYILHDKYHLNRVEMATLKDKEKCVNGIPIDILSRANLFINDASITA